MARKTAHVVTEQLDPSEYRSAAGVKADVKAGRGYAINADGTISTGREAVADRDDPMAAYRPK